MTPRADRSTRDVLVAIVMTSLIAIATVPARELQDLSGGWTPTKETPPGITAAPSPVFGPRFWLRQQGWTLTVVRPVRDTAVVAVHEIDGAEVRSRVPGATCLGDAAVVTAVT